MSKTGYDGSVAGATFGTISKVMGIDGGGMSQDVSQLRCIDDTNKVGENIFGGVTHEPVEVQIKYNDGAQYDNLVDEIDTTDTWTITYETGVTKAGSAKVTAVSGVSQGTDGGNVYSITITPVNAWTVTKTP